MAPTSGNSASSQVGPSTGIPSPEGQSISKKTEIKKTDEEDAAAGAAEALFEVEQAKKPEPKAPTINQRANVLAGRHYERLGKMGNVVAFAKIARQALTAGWPDRAVDAAMAWIAENQFTLTGERLANTLKGGPKPPSRPAPARPSNGARPVGSQLLEY
jgi:hypothetical protein